MKHGKKDWNFFKILWPNLKLKKNTCSQKVNQFTRNFITLHWTWSSMPRLPRGILIGHKPRKAHVARGVWYRRVKIREILSNHFLACVTIPKTQTSQHFASVGQARTHQLKSLHCGDVHFSWRRRLSIWEMCPVQLEFDILFCIGPDLSFKRSSSSRPNVRLF